MSNGEKRQRNYRRRTKNNNIRLHNQCKSLSQISKIVNRPRATIQHIIDRFCERKSLKNARRTGRPRKLSKYCENVIIRKVKKKSTHQCS